MSIKDYLEFTSPEESGSSYPRISVTGLAKQETNIDYVEMTPEGDIIYLMNGNSASLRNLTKKVGMPISSFISTLNRPDLEGRQLSFDVTREGARVGNIPLDNQHLLDIGELAASLVIEGRLTKRTGDSAQI